MQLETILNRVQKFKSFVYKSERWTGSSETPELEVEVAERSNGKLVCSGCGCRKPGYDRLPRRHFSGSGAGFGGVAMGYRSRRDDGVDFQDQRV